MKTRYQGLLVCMAIAGVFVWFFIRYEQTHIHFDNYKIYDKINNYRAMQGDNKLSFDNQLCILAEKRLVELHTDFSHAGFYQYVDTSKWMGENIAMGDTSVDGLVNGWIASTGHRENILNPHFTKTCVRNDADGTNYSIQEFSN